MGELVLNPTTTLLWTARAFVIAALTGIVGTTSQSGPTTMKAGELHRSVFGNGIEESRVPWRVVSQPPRRNLGVLWDHGCLEPERVGAQARGAKELAPGTYGAWQAG